MMLANDKPLPRQYFNHALSGGWSDRRDCHIRTDLVLTYRKPDETALELVRPGSHIGTDRDYLALLLQGRKTWRHPRVKPAS